MRRYRAALLKETILLKRDFGGLVVLFIMPLVLLITVSLIQHTSFKGVNHTSFSVAIVDMDNDSIGFLIKKRLSQLGSFKVKQLEQFSRLKEKINAGDFPFGIVIPKELTTQLREKVNLEVESTLEQLESVDPTIHKNQKLAEVSQIQLFFDPTTPPSFRNAIKSNIQQAISNIERQLIYKGFAEQLSGDGSALKMKTSGFVSFNENAASKKPTEINSQNSVQHNVPAWTLFAVFFIIVPLAVNMVKEKKQGTYLRLFTLPISYTHIIGGKIGVYLGVTAIQMIFMYGVGKYIFPYIGLPPFELESSFWIYLSLGLISGLAAISLGILIGTLANTQEQAAPFGATLVVILAAIGGVWVPVFLMPKFMQFISAFSPMNWGLSALHDICLRQLSLVSVIKEIVFLLLFTTVNLFISIKANEKISKFN